MTTVSIAAPASAEPTETGATYRTLPHNIEAEKGLLGAIFVDNRAYERVSEFLRAEHFFLPAHGRIFDACQRLIERGQMADPVTLKPYFEQSEMLAEIGGPAYLIDIAESAVTIINAGEYGRIVYDLHIKRQLVMLGEDMVNRIYGETADESAVEQIEVAEQKLYDLATVGEYGGGFESFKDSILKAIATAEAAHKRDGGLAGVTTGFIDIDKLLGGLHPSDLIILAGRPSMGKTALATNMAYNAAYSYLKSDGQEGAVVGFFSLEMSSEQLAARIISEQTNISSDKMRKGELTNEEFGRLVVASQELHRVPLFIDDTPALTVSALRTRARRLKRQHNLGMIVIDYLQLISAGPGSRSDGRVQEVSAITRGLKTLAKELDIPVLALSQLSRQVEQRDDKRPQLSDLRESGSIEQDSDVVMFIFREEYYLERGEPIQGQHESEDNYRKKLERWEQRILETRNLAEINVAKQRHGPIGTRKLYFDGTYTRFGDWDREHAPSAPQPYSAPAPARVESLPPAENDDDSPLDDL
ncbi:MAG: replicative DNA helicase [Rhodospirillales bacterium]